MIYNDKKLEAKIAAYNRDVDVLVDTCGRHLSFKEECRMLDSLEAMFGRKVDLMTKDALESMMNPYLKASISSTARLVHSNHSADQGTK
jgi:predicted nucleotidyltransferase